MKVDETFDLNMRLGRTWEEGEVAVVFVPLPLGLVCFNLHCSPRDSSLSPAEAQLLESCF